VQRGAKWDEVKVKELTGGDMIKAQFMRENWFSFKPSHTLWICGNDKPRIAGTDRGIWRRMRLIPFTATIDTPDVELDAKLRAERGIVLRWCLDGVATYMRDGLGTCERVERATKEYRSDQDRLGQALADLCDFGPDLVVIKKHFRGALQRHYDDSGFGQAPGDTTLKSDLARRGIESVRPDRGGAWCWRGIALKPEFAQTEPAKRGWGGSHD
jgi:putative DNA primase/helicase